MTIIDSSVLLAVLLKEADHEIYLDFIASTSDIRIAAPTYLETCMVANFRIGPTGVDEIQQLVEQMEIKVLEFSAATARVAVLAFKRYGKGQGHKAQLNFGDCMSYAMSKTELMPLLFKGDDFRLTDVDCAI